MVDCGGVQRPSISRQNRGEEGSKFQNLRVHFSDNPSENFSAKNDLQNNFKFYTEMSSEVL